MPRTVYSQFPILYAVRLKGTGQHIINLQNDRLTKDGQILRSFPVKKRVSGEFEDLWPAQKQKGNLSNQRCNQ